MGPKYHGGVEDRDEKKLARIREKDARPRHTRADFEPGDRVEFLPDGVTGTIRVSAGGFSHVVWDDEKELGGSRVANENLRRTD
jgi:hypothetical protein